MAQASTTHYKPWRVLGIFIAIVAALVVWAFWPTAESNAPRLGLDLQGGTQVTLLPKSAPGQSGTITQDQVDQAVEIIRQRVDGLGVAESEVTTQGSGASAAIVVSVPGSVPQDRLVELVGRTALLDFRAVDTILAPQTADAAASAAASAQAEASKSAQAEASASPQASKSAASASKSAKAQASKSAKASKSASQTPSATASESASAASRSKARNAASGSPSAAAAATSAEPSPTAAPASAAAASQSATPTEQASPSPTASTAAAEPDIPIQAKQNDAAFQKAYDKLDCTLPQNHSGGAPDDPTLWLATCDLDGSAKYVLNPAFIRGTQVTNAQAQLDPQTNTWAVSLNFDTEGSKKLAQISSEIYQKTPPQNQFAIVLDSIVYSAPRFVEPIGGGQAQITGDFTAQEAADLANVLKYGSLPITLEVAQVSSISPTLGTDYLHAGLLAGALGLALVALYLLGYYRALGMVAVASLGLAGVITYSLFVVLGRQLGFTLTLAGVAGAIVSIGITADSFIVYFERIRDEIREGRTLRVAAEKGWLRARRTLLAADFVSLLGAVVLYVLSIGSVRGFAFALGVTTIVDVFVAFLFTRPVVALLARTEWFRSGSKWTGVDPHRLGLDDATATAIKSASMAGRN